MGSPCSLTEGPGAIRRLRPPVVPRPPRAPPAMRSYPARRGSPSHLAMIGWNRPCLVPTGQRSCPFLSRARPSRQRIPVRPRGHQPPPPRPQPNDPRREWEGCCLPCSPGYRRGAERTPACSVPEWALLPSDSGSLGNGAEPERASRSSAVCETLGAALARAGNTRQALHPS